MLKIAIQGERGAYSEQAARAYFGDDIELILCENFTKLCHQIDSGQADNAMLPVENSTAGSVIPAYDALIASNCKVIGETSIAIHHCLLANQNIKLEQITEARSHPQALAQSDNFLKSHQIKPVVFYDTAGSAKALSDNPNQHQAAIASSLAADIYGLTILANNIEDLDNNQTRFLVLSNKESLTNAEGPYKSIIHCSLKHEPGALLSLLTLLAEQGCNLSKIESRPDRQTPFRYQFIIDIQHIIQINKIIDLHHDLLDTWRVLGSYHKT